MVRVAVIHPDLGVGGAERLIVDASKALRDHGRVVDIFTGYHDPKRCFEETCDGSLKVTVLGRWIPRTILGRFHALLAYLKMIYIAIYLLLFQHSYDLILCDQVSACIPFLKLDFIRNKRPKIVFYCHFPDQLLTQRESLIKAIYRRPLDKFEEWSTGLADIILVNSKFTRTVVRRTFPSLRNRDLVVLYPCVDVEGLNRCKPSLKDCDTIYKQFKKLNENQFIFLSLNRFERKKGLTTAIEALSDCLFKLVNDRASLKLSSSNRKDRMHLIIAGGYDPRLKDCVVYRDELIQMTQDLGLSDHVTFIESPSDEDKLKLLRLCDAVIYTPENEHFGIVPLEAMAMGKSVVASASGGPLETIEDGRNGFLCSRDNDGSFIDAMIKLFSDQKSCESMGQRGLERVRDSFSFKAFSDKLNQICFS